MVTVLNASTFVASKSIRKSGQGGYKSPNKTIMLMMIDEHWKEHLRMDDLKQSVQNATYEQKVPFDI